MNEQRFQEVTRAYAGRRLAVVGDFCLDRYLEIDPGKTEISIETRLPVYNVVRVRSQPGGAGTIVNNLVALGVGEIHAVGFCGEDGEGMELVRALGRQPNVRLDHFLTTASRRTFTYAKPLVLEPGRPPRELSRLDSKNWTRTPPDVEWQMERALEAVAEEVDGIILLDQVDVPDTGVLTSRVLERVGALGRARPEALILADSRRGLRGYPPVTFKMNQAELAALTGRDGLADLREIQALTGKMARAHERPVIVTLAERGMVGADATGRVEHVRNPALRGPIDIVGAGDAVTANLAVALVSGASLGEAMRLANAAASVVIHQMGTTGSASVEDLKRLLVVG